MDGTAQHGVAVGGREGRCQVRHSGQVQPPVGEHFEDQRVLAGRTRRGDTPPGLVLREVEPLGAVGEERGAGFLQIEPARVDLAEVRQQENFRVAGAAGQLTGATEQFVVGEVTEEAAAEVVSEDAAMEDVASKVIVAEVEQMRNLTRRALCPHGCNVRRQ